MTFFDSDYIETVKVYGRVGTVLGSIGFTIEGGGEPSSSTEFGSAAGKKFSISPPLGREIVAMRGRAGRVIDAIGVSFNKLMPVSVPK